MEIALYVRVSTNRQQHAQTIEHQLERLHTSVAAHPEWPGETVAIREALDLSELRLESFPECASPAFVVVGS